MLPTRPITSPWRTCWPCSHIDLRKVAIEGAAQGIGMFQFDGDCHNRQQDHCSRPAPKAQPPPECLLELRNPDRHASTSSPKSDGDASRSHCCLNASPATGKSSRLSPFPRLGRGRGVTAKTDSSRKVPPSRASSADTGTCSGWLEGIRRTRADAGAGAPGELLATPEAHSRRDRAPLRQASSKRFRAHGDWRIHRPGAACAPGM